MELIDILRDVQQDMQVVLVDDKGQLTFTGCMLLASVHFACLYAIKEMLKK